MENQQIWLSIIVMLAFTSQAISGFGSIIIAVTLGSLFIPIKYLLPTVVPLDVFLSTYIVLRYRRYIHFELLRRQLLPFILFGLPIGLLIFSQTEGVLLKKLYGGFILLISLRELFRRTVENKSITRSASALLILLSGLIQGMFASGGPLIAYAVSRLKLSKEAFRSTLCVVWFFCNTTLTASYAISGNLNQETLVSSALLLPFVFFGGAIGDRLHPIISERLFKNFIYVTLALAGTAILLV